MIINKVFKLESSKVTTQYGFNKGLRLFGEEEYNITVK